MTKGKVILKPYGLPENNGQKEELKVQKLEKKKEEKMEEEK